jgi:hypothetical protein
MPSVRARPVFPASYLPIRGHCRHIPRENTCISKNSSRKPRPSSSAWPRSWAWKAPPRSAARTCCSPSSRNEAERWRADHGSWARSRCCQDGFGFLRSPEANYLAGPDDIYVSPNQVRRFGLRTGDTVEGEIRAPQATASAISRSPSSTAVNFDDPDVVRHRVNFDNLTPLYPDAEAAISTRSTRRSRTSRPASSISSARRARASAR